MSAVVAICELRRFAGLRQRIGYGLASAVISSVAARIASELPGCQLGRLGRTSIEFVFEVNAATAVTPVLERLAVELEKTIAVQGYEFDLRVAIGAVNAGEAAISDQHLDAASLALAVAQDDGLRVMVHQEGEQSVIAVEEVAIFRDLRRAIRNDEPDLFYQPKLHCRDNSVGAAEALLRWQHPEHGLMRTDKVIEIAEATGAIRDLTKWTVDRLVADQAQLRAAGQAVVLYVNISGALLGDTGFIDWLLERMDGRPGCFGLEITETAVIDDPDTAIAHLHRIAEAGIKIAIDDYGSGLSSLAYLKQLPAHELKIDRMFVSGLTESHRDPLLVRSSIDLAHAMEMQVTAEGVDDPISLALLKVMGCDLAQGYLISRPLPLDALISYLAGEQHLEHSGHDPVEQQRRHLTALVGRD